jgi:hypothetical protein
MERLKPSEALVIIIFIFVLLPLAGSALLMFGLNCSIPIIFKGAVNPIDFWQAMALYVLFSVISHFFSRSK